MNFKIFRLILNNLYHEPIYTGLCYVGMLLLRVRQVTQFIVTDYKILDTFMLIN